MTPGLWVLVALLAGNITLVVSAALLRRSAQQMFRSAQQARSEAISIYQQWTAAVEQHVAVSKSAERRLADQTLDEQIMRLMTPPPLGQMVLKKTV